MPREDEFIIVADYSNADEELTLDEFVEITHLTEDLIFKYIDYAIIQPEGSRPDEWLFDVSHIKRIQRALRLQHDLEVNLAGVAVVLDLLDEMDEMRKRMALLEKLYLK